jgi:hypothetical protein
VVRPFRLGVGLSSGSFSRMRFVLATVRFDQCRYFKGTRVPFGGNAFTLAIINSGPFARAPKKAAAPDKGGR